jgi:hypothetical protein
MMLGLGTMLVVSPATLSNLTAAVGILGGAIAATVVIVAVDRRLQRRRTPAVSGKGAHW